MYGERVEFDEAESRLPDAKEVRRWMHWVKTQVRVGIELEKAGRLRNSYEFGQLLDQSGSYEKLTKFNVVQLVTDGSVNGGGPRFSGNEILVCGTNEDFATAHRKMVGLHALIKEHGLKVDNSCGMHYHLVAAQDDRMPQVILKNFYQLVRRYYAALLYLTGTTNAAGFLTRKSHTLHSSQGRMYFYSPHHLKVSPLGKTMKTVKDEIGARAGRYCAFNMGKVIEGQPAKDLLKFNTDGSIARFQVELRFPDASDVSAQIVSQMFLFRALLMKAVELSQFGVMRVDTSGNNWESNKAAVDVFSGYMLGFSSSQRATFEGAVNFAKEDAMNLLMSLRSHLMNIDGESWGVLVAMADKPVWQRRRGRQSWSRIEKALMPAERVLDGVAQQLLKLISMNQLVGVKNIAQWKYEASRNLEVQQNVVINAMRILEQELKLDFDRELGSYVVRW